jgi:hypothetical protein
MGLNRNLGNIPEVIKENSGFIGIGSATPLNKLDVAGNISLSSGGSNVIRMLQSVAAAAYNGPGFYSQTSIGYGVATGGSHIFIGSTDGNTEVMRINSVGNVGIGTQNPTLFAGYTTLAVNGPSGCALELKAGDVSGLRIFSDTGSSYLYENRNTALKFYTNGSLNAAMFPSGNMNIGTSLTDEGYKLYVDGYLAVKSGGYGGGGYVIKNYAASAASRNWGIFNDQLVFGDLCINTSATQTGSPGTTRIYITPDGTTLFRRTTSLDPSYAAGFEGAVFFKCAVNGNNSVNFFNASTTYVASIVTNASSVVYGTGSDYRLKEDLKDFNGLEKISKIKVYDFKFIKENDRMDGVLAHELQEIVPYAVTGKKDEIDDKGNVKIQNVDYAKLTPILIKAVQEQQEIIKKLTNRITNLENK